MFAFGFQKGSGLFAILPQPKGFTSLPKDISFLKKSAPSDSTTPNTKASLSASSSVAAPSSSTASTPLPRSLIPDSVKNLGKRPPPSKLEEIKAKYMKQEANVVIVSRSVENKKALLAGGSSKVKKGVNEESDDSDEDSSTPNFFSFESGASNGIDEETLEKLKLPMPNFNQFPTSSTNQAEEADEDYDNEATASSSSTTVQQDFVSQMDNRNDATLYIYNY